ncbi:hypothetical protein ACFCWG_11930 [Streptomyces sp. NPDC056390]|uniref:hypothetical protein n=1 Tax=Streptomyces sp. NPDC056390 TaxID=3345806 RepID=UPI0035DCCC12
MATIAARQALKPLKNDPERQARGRGKAVDNGRLHGFESLAEQRLFVCSRP